MTQVSILPKQFTAEDAYDNGRNHGLDNMPRSAMRSNFMEHQNEWHHGYDDGLRRYAEAVAKYSRNTDSLRNWSA